MTDYFIRLKGIDIDNDNDNDEIEYHFKLIQNLNEEGEIPFTTIEADQPLNNQILGFSGKTRVIPINWIIYDNGNDKSSGTWGNQLGSSFDSNLGSDIITVQDQIYYLQRYIHNSTLGAAWRLYGGRFSDPDGDGTDEGTPVAMQPVDIRETADRQAAVSATTRLLVGDVV